MRQCVNIVLARTSSGDQHAEGNRRGTARDEKFKDGILEDFAFWSVDGGRPAVTLASQIRTRHRVGACSAVQQAHRRPLPRAASRSPVHNNLLTWDAQSMARRLKG